MNPRNWGAAEWAAFGTVAAILVGGAIALWQVFEVRTQRKEQARPFVVVDFEFRSILVYLQIRNIGTTIARDVSITFDKPLESTLSRPREIDDSPLLKRPIPMIAPGRRISLLFDSFTARADNGTLPMDYIVTLSYRDVHGNRFEDPSYPLDLGVYAETAIDPKGLPELVRELEQIRREIAKWTDGIRRLRVSNVNKES